MYHDNMKSKHYKSNLYFTAIGQKGGCWTLFGASIEDGSNVIGNDTIPLRFALSRITFYWEDGVPDYRCVCKQIAV